MRSIAEVISKMLTVIPTEETVLRAQLLKVQEDSFYRAPEAQKFCWREVNAVLVDRFPEGPPDSGWAEELAKIWSGE